MKDKIRQFRISFNRFAKKNILVIIMLVFLCPILGYSYSTFIFDTDDYRSNEMYIGNLLYSIKVDGVNTSSVSVPANSEVEALVQVTSLNEVSSNYKLVHNTLPGVTVVYASDEHLPTYGLITTSQSSTVLITNTTSSAITINFEVVGGYSTNNIANISVPNGYSLVSNTYMKYDYETLSLFGDNVRVSELDTTKRYNLLSSTCTNNETVTYNSIIRSITVTPSDEQTKCQLYFEEKSNSTLTEKMLEDNTAISDASINFATISSVSNGQGLYYTSDLDKTEGGERVYYYRGAVTNNYVQFAGFCWKIVRTNEDGSVKLMYWGPKNGTTCSTTALAPTSLAIKAYNTEHVNTSHIGYMYGSSCTDYSSCNSNVVSSTIKGLIDEWYNTNIANEYRTKISNTIYCNDRTLGNAGSVNGVLFVATGEPLNNAIYSATRRIATGGSNGTSFTAYAASPQYDCPNDARDAFTLKVASGGTEGYGNNKLDYPVGLLTADEISYAGAAYGLTNNTFFLNTGGTYWTMSPFYAGPGYTIIFVVTASTFTNEFGDRSLNAFPVISLNFSALVSSGDGHATTPYVIQ